MVWQLTLLLQLADFKLPNGSLTAKLLVTSQMNLANHAFRGLTTKDYLECSSWLTGPDFPWKTEDYWPCNPDVNSFTLPCELLSPSPKVYLFMFEY